MGAEDHKRSSILTAALHLFVAFGYDGVGVLQIVEAATVTKPTLYHYFGSKLGLLEALFDEELEDLHHALLRDAQYRHDLSLTLMEIARGVFGFARSRPEPFRLYLSLWFAPAQREAYRVAARLHERNFTILENLFREAASDHGNMRGRHRAYAATFLGMPNNYVALSQPFQRDNTPESFGERRLPRAHQRRAAGSFHPSRLLRSSPNSSRLQPALQA
jgi:AcrR family transcriptional regulator